MLNNIQQPDDNLLNFLISFGTQINQSNERVTPVPFQNVVQQIRTGSNGLAAKIEKYRSLPAITIKDGEARSKYKENNLPYFSPGIFKDNHKINANLVEIGHMVFDFDHLNRKDLQELKSKFMADNHTFCLFTSPSGKGLKVMCKLESAVTDPDYYKKLYIHHGDLFTSEYGHPWDERTKPVAQACFLAYDPDIYINHDSLPLSTDVPSIQSSDVPKPSKASDPLAELLANGTTDGDRTNRTVQIVGHCLKRGCSEAVSVETVKMWNQKNNPPQTEKEIVERVKDLYQRYQEKNEALANYWSYGTDILDIGIIDSKFYMEKNNLHKVYVRVGAFSEQDRSKIYTHLVNAKHIPHLARINHLGDLGIDQSSYRYLADKAELDVHYSAVPSLVQDNKFIEQYLERLFGCYKQFIKEWLAVYCYTNYRKLPFVILNGPRGCGKNTFAETIADIFPTISTMWHGTEKNFNPEVEKKLLIADETVSNDEQQYKTLKKYSGQKETVVNHKYLKPYAAPNNMNVIILSNAKIPIFVERDEKPSCEENNQFFVYSVKEFTGKIDEGLRRKLVDRMGHYIRTELKTVFDGLSMDGNRYSIKVPITPEEMALFENNVTTVQATTDQYLMKLIGKYNDGGDPDFENFVNLHYLPVSFFDDYMFGHNVKRIDVIKNLVNLGYLAAIQPERKMVNGRRQYVYPITDALLKRISEKTVVLKPKQTIHPDPAQLDLPILPVDCPQNSETLDSEICSSEAVLKDNESIAHIAH